MCFLGFLIHPVLQPIIGCQHDINRDCAAFLAAQPFLYLTGSVASQMALADILPKHHDITPSATACAAERSKFFSRPNGKNGCVELILHRAILWPCPDMGT
tara:strand:- start:1476 stop:1778 length:303 start_codon:yes stop_codon:yes gene_type:complete